MKYSIELRALSHRPDKDKTFPVNIRIGYRSKYIFFNTEQRATKSNLNKKGEIKTQAILLKCEPKLQEYREILEKIDESRITSVYDIKEYIEKGINPNKEVNFLSYYKEIYDKLQQEGSKSLHIYKALYNHLCRFKAVYLPKKVFSMQSITLDLVKNFERFLKESEVKERGLSMYMTYFKGIFLKCKEEYEEYGILFRDAFKFYDMPKTPRKRKAKALTKQQIQAILTYQFPDNEKNDQAKRAQDAFAISLLTLGTNAADLFNLKAPAKGRIEYERQKVQDRRDDRGFISIKIEPELKPYLKRCKGKNGYAFNFRDHHENNLQFNKAISLGLRKIAHLINQPHRITWLQKKGYQAEQIDRLMEVCFKSHKQVKRISEKGLTEEETAKLRQLKINPSLIPQIVENDFIKPFEYYDARRTMASVMKNELGISKDDIAGCLNHVDTEHYVTDIYIEVDFKFLDCCNRKFIDWIFS